MFGRTYFFVPLMLVLASGCGAPKYYKCSGVVTHDGKPVPFLQLNFAPLIVDSVRIPLGFTDKDGRFVMTCGRHVGIPPGVYTVHAEDPVAADGRQASTEADYLYVIDRYSPQNSDYQYTADRHRTDFELKLDTKEYAAHKSIQTGTGLIENRSALDSR